MNNYLIDTFVYLNKNSISHELCDDLIKLGVDPIIEVKILFTLI